MDYKNKWNSAFCGKEGKVSAVRVAFLLWMFMFSLCWGVMCISQNKLADIPPTVVHITLALGATKVSHRVAEGEWDKVIEVVAKSFAKKK